MDILSSDKGPYEYSTRISGECLEGGIWLRKNATKVLLLSPFMNRKAVSRDLIRNTPRLFATTPDFYNAREILNAKYLFAIPDLNYIVPK